ncbi:hypothetical protein LEP1GSC064_2662 [Leptospira kirschneri serovar Grippotyphosa str. Moskva]|nr:hypothetical protein LEP1GSC064_2662 [Leptospira kirschneri serovar Grippotyphosa str. Moskva]EKR09046.1 hypothetical protein LEP1GSC122_0778 [Leptospira kirschneri serovar Valbuzzi str. 200702274]
MDAQKDLQKFDFTEEIIQHFKINSVIPVDFYNRNGQILIHKKGKCRRRRHYKIIKVRKPRDLLFKIRI